MSDRGNSVWTPRRVVAVFAVVLFSALVASWTSLPARAGSGAAKPPRHLLATRTGTVYLQDLPPATINTGSHRRPLRVADPIAYRRRKAAMDSGATLPALPSIATLALTTTPTFSTNFAGLAFADSDCGPDCEPPDTQVAAGPTAVIAVTNVVFKVFDKNGTVLMNAFSLNSFFNIDTSIFSSDPRIEYDTLAGRWYISLLSLDTSDGAKDPAHNGFFNLAVSNDMDPLDGFNTYSIETPGSFPDQPSLGFNDDKIVTGGNSFSCNPNCDTGPYEGNEFLVWNKSELLAALPSSNVNNVAIDTDFFSPDADGSGFPIIPAKSRTSTSTLWMVSAVGSSLNVWSVTGVPPGSSANLTVASVASFTFPPSCAGAQMGSGCAPQKGSTHKIDTGDERIVDAVFRDGQLWASGTDTCQPSGDLSQRSCLQFFEVLTGGANPVVNQDFSFGTKNFYDYYPSVDLDSSDDLITSFTQSSSTEFPSAYVDGRLAGDPVNTLGTPVLFKAGAKSYTSNDPIKEPFRWGDYSGAGVDPIDQTAIWVAAEYPTSATSSINWGTWIAEARLIAAATSTATPTATATATPTATATATTSATATATDSATPTASPTSTGSGSPTPTGSASPTTSATPTATDTSIATSTPTATATATATATVTATQTATATATQTATPTATPTPPFGTLSVSGELRFGAVKVNSKPTKTLKIKNKGKAPLQVSVGTLDPPFTVLSGSGTFNLSKGKTQRVKVQFMPASKGSTAPQILSIMSDDPKHPMHNLTASGSGK